MAYDQAYLPPYQQSFLMPQAVYHDPYYTDENTFFMSSTDASISDHQHSKIVEEDAEDEDTASRPRLSPEQLAILEDHFQSHHKPNTDFKKQLAEQLGLSLARVNVRISIAAYGAVGSHRDRIGIRTGERSRDISVPRLDDTTSFLATVTACGYSQYITRLGHRNYRKVPGPWWIRYPSSQVLRCLESTTWISLCQGSGR